MLLGRQSELRRVVTLLQEERPLALLGEAGVGKTALLQAAVAELERPAFVGGALATLSWMPYLPLERAFTRAFGAGDAAYAASEVERALQGGLLVLDDLHWADRETRALLPFLTGRVPLAAALRRGDAATPELVAELEALGFELVALEPLAPADAGALARSVRADLPPRTVQEIVRRAGGNPLLVEELAAHGEATTSLRLALQARLRGLSPAGRRALGLLALAGRPLDAGLLGHGCEELEAAGLVAREDGSVTVRHALFAETTAAELEQDERTRLHSYLAAQVDDPGEAARHYAAAGEREAAHRKAREAAEAAGTPGERAEHLAVAADTVEGESATSLRLEAARAFSSGGWYDAADQILDRLRSSEPLIRAEALQIRARASRERDDLDAARALLGEASQLAVTSDSVLALRIALEELDVDLSALDRTENDVTRAERLLAEAQATGRFEALALALLADAKSGGRVAGAGTSNGWEADHAVAIKAARTERDEELEYRVTESLGVRTFVNRGPDPAHVIFMAGAGRAASARAGAWELRFRTRAVWMDLHAGRYRIAFEAAVNLLNEQRDRWQRFLTLYCATQAAVDLGLNDEARRLLAELEGFAGTGNQRLRQVLWARADLEMWGGRPREAVEAAEHALLLFPNEDSPFIRLTRAWAYYELGLDPAPPDIAPPGPIQRGAPSELEGWWHLAAVRPDEAASSFAQATEQWRGCHARGELRCLWAHGEALRQASRSEAIEQLLLAESRAGAHAHQPLVARIRRSLRLAGVRRSAPRARREHGLTAREGEVLDLVASGLTTEQISRRLGIGRATVDRLAETATRKLGARSRAQAAAISSRK